MLSVNAICLFACPRTISASTCTSRALRSGRGICAASDAATAAGRYVCPALTARIAFSSSSCSTSFVYEDHAGDNSIYRTQYRQCPFLKLEGGDVPSQGEVIEAKRLAQPEFPELSVDGVGIGELQTLSSNRDSNLLFGNGERELDLDRSLKIHNLYQRLETVPRHPYRIGSGFQVWRCKLADAVRRKHYWLREDSASDLDPRVGNNCT